MEAALSDVGARLRDALARHDDGAFDAHYGGRADELGRRYWTPLRVVARICELLRGWGARRVLDVGAGPGKFCLAAAASCPTMTFTGVEQRRDLVTKATAAASGLGLANAEFVHGNALDVDWCDYDALYFFNPFGENLYAHPDRYDETVELSGARYMREVALAEARLARLPEGVVVITYHGFGGALPGSFDLVHEGPFGIEELRAWVQTSDTNSRSECWRELAWGGVQRGRFFGT